MGLLRLLPETQIHTSFTWLEYYYMSSQLSLYWTILGEKLVAKKLANQLGSFLGSRWPSWAVKYNVRCLHSLPPNVQLLVMFLLLLQMVRSGVSQTE
jgi:hypothetical protein